MAALGKNLEGAWKTFDDQTVLELEVLGLVVDFDGMAALSTKLDEKPDLDVFRILYTNMSGKFLLSDRLITGVMVELRKRGIRKLIMASLTDGNFYDEQSYFAGEVSNGLEFDLLVQAFQDRKEAIEWVTRAD